jgi:hypothetical protein
MRAFITIAADYPEVLRPALEVCARETDKGEPISGLTPEDLIDALESADECAITDVSVVD